MMTLVMVWGDGFFEEYTSRVEVESFEQALEIARKEEKESDEPFDFYLEDEEGYYSIAFEKYCDERY